MTVRLLDASEIWAIVEQLSKTLLDRNTLDATQMGIWSRPSEKWVLIFGSG
jgi:hypothetical protein